MASPRVVLGADSLQPMASGTGRVARLMARVLADMRVAGEVEARALTLRGESGSECGLDVKSAHGSRARFVTAVHHAALARTCFAYDFSGIARAHPVLPGLRRPYLTWLHGVEVWEGARSDRLRRARHAALLLANSRTTLERASGLHRGLSGARVCWLGTEQDDAPEDPPSGGPPRVLLLGRVDEGGGYKGHRELVDAWPRVVDRVPAARLVFVGGGPGLEVVRAQVAASPARASIDVRGFVEERRLDALWREATVLAMPSRGEGFGLVYVEAMRRAIPVVASVHDAGAEVNVDGETGYNVNLDRRDELPERLVALLLDRDAARAMGDAGRRRWRACFSYGAFRDRFRPLLRDWLGRPGG